MGREYFRDGGVVTVGAGATAELVADTAPHGDPIDLEELAAAPNQPTPLGTVRLTLRIDGLPVHPYISLAGWQRSQSEGQTLPLEVRVAGGSHYSIVATNNGGVAFDLTAVIRGRYSR